MKIQFSKIFKEIIQNIDIYLVISVAIVVGVLGVMQFVSFEIISAATLATLGLIAVSLLASRKTSDEIKTVNTHVLANLEKLSPALKKPKISDVFVFGYPVLSDEIKSAKSIKSLSVN